MSLSVFLDLLKKCPKGIELFIEIENQWQFLHSITGVKQIKEGCENIDVFIFTQDQVGRKLLESVNIPTFDSIPEDAKDYYDEVSPEKKFQKNKIGKAFKSQEFEIIKVIKKSGEDQLHKLYEEIQELPLRNKILLGIMTLISLGVLSFLLAFIMPSASIELSTEKKSIESIVNTNFIKTEVPYTEKQKNENNNFHLYPLEFRFEHEFEFPVISKIFEGQHSFGDITLYNNYYEDITLRDGTKIQTDDGLIFITKHYVRIPARSRVKNEDGVEELKAGEALVNVRANDLDLYQEVIGSRGNIPPQKFFVPGLTNYMQKFIWGESTTEFRGGTTRWRIEVQQSDLDAATEKMKNALFTIAQEEIEKYINEQNITLPNKIALFPLKQYIKEEISKLTFPENILGQSIKSFPVKGEMLVSAYVFDQGDFYRFLENHIHTKRDPHMKIEAVDFSTMTLRRFAETPSEIRVTVDFKGRQSYQVDSDSESGKQFQEALKEEIRGMSKEDALRFISNRPEIQNVTLSIWPPLKRTLPLLKERIEIVEE